MGTYFDEKKLRGFIFTEHDADPKRPYISMDHSRIRDLPIEEPGAVSWWSHLSGRYRNAEEQKRFLDAGCVDEKLPPRDLSKYPQRAHDCGAFSKGV